MEVNDVTNPQSGFVYRRINKTKARNMYNGGFPVVVCPKNTHPFGKSSPWAAINIDEYQGPDNLFERRIEMFSWASQDGNERGMYAAFYVRIDYLTKAYELHLEKKRKNTVPMYMRGK